MARSERLCGERRRQRRVDASGDSEHDVREAVLASVVAQAEPDREPHLLELVERLGDRRADRVLVPPILHGHLDHDGLRQLAAGAGEGTPACVAETAGDCGRRVDVHQQERLLEGRPAHDDRAVLVENEALAVEDQLVLRPDGVHEHDPAGVVPGSRRQHLLALGALADVERGRRDVGDDMCSGQGEVGRGRSGLPDVLADGRPDKRLAAAKEHEAPAGLEVPILVEDPVVGKELLAIHRLHLAVDADRAGVEKVAIEVRRAHERRDAPRRGGDLLQRACRGLQEARAQEEVLRRIARDGELREEHEVGAARPGLFESGEDAIAVAVEVADDRVDLGESKTHARILAVSA